MIVTDVPGIPRSFARSWEQNGGQASDQQALTVLVGPSGYGKTHLAAAIANTRIAEGAPCLFVVVPDLLDQDL